MSLIDRIWARNKGINRRWKLASGFEAVADSAQRFQIAGMAWIALDFLPQTAHEDVNGARGHKRPFFPHRVEELVAGKDASPVPGPIFEEPELADRGEYGFALDAHGHRSDIKFSITPLTTNPSLR